MYEIVIEKTDRNAEIVMDHQNVARDSKHGPKER